MFLNKYLIFLNNVLFNRIFYLNKITEESHSDESLRDVCSLPLML